MRVNALVSVACVLVFSRVHSTFPLRRDTAATKGGAATTPAAAAANGNASNHCEKTVDHHSISDRTKKMTTYIENALKVIKNNGQDSTKCKKDANNRNLNYFEQMVIMKKNPYLDFKELVSKIYNPGGGGKNTRHTVTMEVGLNLKDPSICEVEEIPSVEITNRGLSGFAIPAKLTKAAMMAPTDNKLKLNLQNELTNVTSMGLTGLHNNNTDLGMLRDLVTDIKKFEGTKSIKP